MKPNTISASPVPKAILEPVLPTAKIITHPRAKKMKEHPSVGPPDEETLMRLNAMAKQYPFCVRHRGKNNLL
jgi:hypothetical protein